MSTKNSHARNRDVSFLETMHERLRSFGVSDYSINFFDWTNVAEAAPTEF